MTQSIPTASWMLKSHLADVVRIENACFEYPWDEKSFLATLKHRDVVGSTITLNHEVVGFALYELKTYSIMILNIAIDPDYQKQGLGRFAVQRLLDKLSYGRRTKVIVEVRETNLPAQLFFSSLGFKARSIIHNHYIGFSEPAYLMEYNLLSQE